MSTSLLTSIRDRNPPKDRASSRSEKIGAQFRPDQGKNGLSPAPGWPPKAYPDDLEFSDVGRDPRFIKGRWLGIAILAAVALGAVCLGFVSVWAALALAIVW